MSKLQEVDDFHSVEKRHKTLNHPRLRQQQVWHFILYNIIPFIGFSAGVALLFWFPIGLFEIGLLAGMWLITGLGISIGFHRYYSHRAFECKPWLQVVFVICGSMAAQGPAISWATLHRRHHECSDKEGDPHSPNQHGTGTLGRIKGLWHSHFYWMVQHSYPNPLHYVPDLLKDKRLVRVNRYYHLWVLLGLVAPTALAAVIGQTWMSALMGFLWGGLLRIFVVDHLIWSINSICHVYGQREFNTRDYSTNNLWLAFPTMGEALQNNHHAFPHSAILSLHWWQCDIGAMTLLLFKKLGWAWALKTPTQRDIDSKLLSNAC